MSKQRYGAGIWHFATYVDRYATDGYGPARSLVGLVNAPASSLVRVVQAHLDAAPAPAEAPAEAAPQ